MHAIRTDLRSLLGLLVGLAVAVGALLLLAAGSAAAQDEPAAPLARYAFIARADNPVDTLAASAIAGQLGAPVYLTSSTSLGQDARDALVAAAPDVLIIAGGTDAISTAVEDDLREALPDTEIRRIGGPGRTQTAVALNQLADEIGFERPVLAGATVAGDVGIEGSLTLSGTDVGAALAALTARMDGLETELAATNARTDQLETDLATANGRIGTLESDLATANGRIDTLEGGLATANDRIDTLEGGLATANGRIDTLETDLADTRADLAAANDRIDVVEGGLAAANDRIGTLEGLLAGVSRAGNTLTFGSMNVAIVNGQGSTGTTNGLGNLIIGYAEDHTDGATYSGYDGDGLADTRGGSHNLVVGVDHSWDSFGGIVAGLDNDVDGIFANVTGGRRNQASGLAAAVAGGSGNLAGSDYTAVAGGNGNEANGYIASVAGGSGNVASGDSSSVAGGANNLASGTATTIAGGLDGAVANEYDSRIGNTDFADS